MKAKRGETMSDFIARVASELIRNYPNHAEDIARWLQDEVKKQKECV